MVKSLGRREWSQMCVSEDCLLLGVAVGMVVDAPAITVLIKLEKKRTNNISDFFVHVMVAA